MPFGPSRIRVPGATDQPNRADAARVLAAAAEETSFSGSQAIAGAPTGRSTETLDQKATDSAEEPKTSVTVVVLFKQAALPQRALQKIERRVRLRQLSHVTASHLVSLVAADGFA